MAKRVKPKIIIKKLGNERAWGTSWREGHRHYMELDPRVGAKRFLETAVHEQVHLCLPEASEKKVDRMGKDISDTLWRLGYRRVLAEKHSTPVRIT